MGSHRKNVINSIEVVLDAGLTVTNTKGGYMKYEGNNEYLFQTEYRSSNYGVFEDMVEQFLEEANIDI